MLNIENLEVKIKNKLILQDVNLRVNKGETHVIMGPNGSGKSTLAHVLVGDPAYRISGGQIKFQHKNIKNLNALARVYAGIFMVFQNPREIEGVQLNRFLFLAYNAVMKARGRTKSVLSVFDFNKKLLAQAKLLKLSPDFLERSLNKGLSGGEKKKTEMLQLATLEPKLVILDEIDSGLDIDALKIISRAVNKYKTKDNALIIITHYSRILKYVRPDKVHVMVNGKIVDSGKTQLLQRIESKGFNQYLN